MHMCTLQLKLLNEVSSAWWEMKNSQGQKGMVPVNYIKKSKSSEMLEPSSSDSSVSESAAVECSQVQYMRMMRQSALPYSNYYLYII